MGELILFVPLAEKDAEANLEHFCLLCRTKLATYGKDLQFEEDEWDITGFVKLKARGNRRVRLRFYTFSSLKSHIPVAMAEPYKSFAKAYMRYTNATRSLTSFNSILTALRMIYEALVERNSATPTSIDAATLNRAAQITIQNYGDSASCIGTHIQKIGTFISRHRLTSIPLNDWKNPIKNPRNSTRVGPQFDEARASKLPSEAALDALPKIFRLAEETPYVLVSSIAAILCAAPDRINEVLLLPQDCEAYQKNSDGSEAYGLRWWPAKGADPMVKWIIPSMIDVVKEAIKKIRNCTKHAREVANWYEKNPKKVFLLPEYEYLREKDLLRNFEVGYVIFGKEVDRSVINDFYKSKGIKTTCVEGKHYARFSDVENFILAKLPFGFPWLDTENGLKYSEALCIVCKNDLATCRSSWVGMFQPISIDQVNDRLRPRNGSNHITIFERYGFREPDGSAIKVKSNQFRHYLNTLAQAGGLSQLDIAKWSGRKNIHQNAAYDHMSADELVLKVRAAIGDDQRMFGPLSELPKRLVISRDEFARLKVPTAHTTEFGACIHDYTMSPCQMHADCLNCAEHVCIKGDQAREARIRNELRTSTENLALAEKACVEGYAGASRWEQHHRLAVERLTQLCKVLDDPNIPNGSVIQLSYLRPTSRVEQATEIRKTLESGTRFQNHESLADNEIRSLLATMGRNNG